MNNDLAVNTHLLPLNIDDDHTYQESDSDSCSIDSDIDVNDTDCVSDDSMQLNRSNDENSSEDEIKNLIIFNINEEVICIDPTPSSSTSSASTSYDSTTTVFITQHKRRQWTFIAKLEYELVLLMILT